MADFVAVIRRAVDGLATNTPETRARVYEKARGAVQRQLENMKPKPPEEMLRRQMDKLEAAIASVETEHSEALPSEDAAAYDAPDAYEAAQPDAEQEPAGGPAAVSEPEAPLTATEPVTADERAPEDNFAASPAHQDDAREEETPAEELQAEEDWRAAPAEVAERESENHWPPATAPMPMPVEEEPRQDLRPLEPEDHAAAASIEHHEEPVGRFGDWRDDVPVEESRYPDAEEPPQQAEPVVADQYPHVSPAEDDYRPAEEPNREPPRFFEPEPASTNWPDERQAAVASDVAPEPAPAEQWGWPDAEKQTEQPVADNRAASSPSWDHIDDLTRNLDVGSRGEPVEAHFDREIRVSAEPVRMPAASDIPQPAAVADNRASNDPFEDYVNAQPAAASPAKPDDRDPWSDLEDLIGYTKEAPASEPKAQAQSQEGEFDDLLSPPAKPYRVTPVRKRNYGGIILGILGLLIVGGGAYAVWLNRDSLNDIVGGLIQSSTTGEETAQQSPPATAPADQPEASQQTPAAQPPQETATAPDAQQTTPPPADGASTANKFTQRLMQDGSETDAGPGEAGSLAQNAEGQSVAQLNAPPADPGPSAPPAEAGAAAPAPGSANAPATPSASPSETPAAAGEKMFLYEERIGQSAPTAIEGSVSWSLQREPASNGGPPEPVIQGRITVPGRGLTALLTVKRNSDSSLPASHLIEIVFAVPPDFEGGAIDSVLRIAMKQTEQDRGNALVAVPAKITDDFHMIALNDFPDARATNLDLLRSRDWIDIPVAYRNGRRALFTLQKGPEGRQAFEEATREWSQAGSAPTGQ